MEKSKCWVRFKHDIYVDTFGGGFGNIKYRKDDVAEILLTRLTLSNVEVTCFEILESCKQHTVWNWSFTELSPLELLALEAGDDEINDL